jgi:hypothetical protein
MQHGHEAQKFRTDVQHEQVAWKSSRDMHTPAKWNRASGVARQREEKREFAPFFRA